VKLNKFLSLSVIYIIISLTFVASLAFAEIYSVDVYGRDNVPGTVRSGDSLTVKSTSIMPCSVQLPGNDSFIAMTCGSGTPITCSYTKSFPNITGKIDVTVKESGSEITHQASAYVDNLAPSINSLTTSSLGLGVIANYNLKDQANDLFPDNCSGIKKVELLLDGKLINTTSHPISKCNVVGSIVGTIANFEGTVNTSINVYDYLDQKANRTGSIVSFESKPPKIASSAKVYISKSDFQITKYSNASANMIKAYVKVVITDSAMLASNVLANLTELDKTTPSTIVTASSCDEDENQAGNFICVFSDINFKPMKSNPKIRVTAKDSSGNEASQDITFSFTMVSSAGTVKSIGPSSEKCFENKCYLKSGENELIAQIDTISSFNSSDVMIGGVQAACMPESGWICKAKVIVSSSAIKLEGYDDIGNPIQGTSTGIVIDSAVPEKTAEFNVTPSCPTSSESLSVSVDVIDNSPALKIKAVTSAISSTNLSEAPCSKNEYDQWHCTLNIGGLKSQQTNTKLNVIVEDLAGNQLVQEVPVSICVSSSAAPSLIKEIRAAGKLPKIDKKVASKIEVKVPISLEIVQSASINILERSRIDCSGTPGIGEPYIINDDSLNPILILPLSYDQAWDYDNKVHVNCTQEFKLRSGNTIYSEPEDETISFEIPAFNQGLSSLDKNYEKKIKEMKSRVRTLDDDITMHENTWDWLGLGCKLAEGASKANSIIQAWRSTMWGFAIGLYSTGIGTGAAEAVWKIANIAGNEMHGTVEKMIWPAGWMPSNANYIGLAVKWTCTIYTCKLYDFNTVFSIAMALGDEFIASPAKDMGEWETPDEAAEKVTSEVGNLININLLNSGSSNSKLDFGLTGYDVAGTSLTPSDSGTGIPTGIISMWTMNLAIQGFLGDEGSWIYNPYKSVHYDSWCPPAIMFNDRKERQLTCKRIGCYEAMMEMGGPLEACDFDYQRDMCMYVESARYKISGDEATFGNVMGSLGRQFMNNIVGIGTSITYAYVLGCRDYQLPTTWTYDTVPVPMGWKTVTCGIVGSAMSASELLSFAQNPLNALSGAGTTPTDIPSSSVDYCSGVDYASSK